MFNEPHTSTAAAARPKDSLGCLSSQLHKDLELDTGEFKFFRKCTRDDKTSAVTIQCCASAAWPIARRISPLTRHSSA
jgi:AraC family transcriptional regulator